MLALPHQSPAGFQDMSVSFMEILMNDPDYIGKTQPTGGGPSVINGGIDQMDWAFEQEDVYEYMKNIAAPMLGVDGRGIADVGLGEYYLERNERLKSINYLMAGLAELKGRENFRGYYAGSAIMARGFLEENRMDTAQDILKKLLEQVKTSDFPELADNIRATYMECLLYKGIDTEVLQWIDHEKAEGVGNMSNTDFFISERHRMYVLIKGYIAVGKYLEAAVLIRQLTIFAERYGRKYISIKMQLMNGILCDKQELDGTEYVICAVLAAAKNGYVRMIADEGAGLLPIWRKIDWEEVMEQYSDELPENFSYYLKQVEKELKFMSGYYPAYMKLNAEEPVLSKTEKMVMDLIYSGNSNEKIAMKMDISLSTVKFHVSNIYKKLGVKKRNQAVKKVAEMGWNQ
jgi:LuxR family maltose regulon positive regulatory protein